MSDSDEIQALVAQVCVVTVTYGDRMGLLERSIALSAEAGVRNWVIVCNGIHPAGKMRLNDLKKRFGQNLRIHEELVNSGSARGFAQGIGLALDNAAVKFLWLLDDDCGPHPDALYVLIRTYIEQSKDFQGGDIGLMSLRSDRPIFLQIANGVEPRNVFPSPHSILGFHFVHTPMKKIKRAINKLKPQYIAQKKHRSQHQFQAVREIPYGPYGGLFLSRNLLRNIGLPDERFVLYGDDSEFSARIAKTGGRLLLVPASVIDDLEPSWHRTAPHRSLFGRLLLSENAFRVYYSIRNEVFSSSISRDRSTIFLINRNIFIFLLWFFSILYGRKERYKLLRQAIDDGVAGRLGVNDDLPLP